MSNRIADYLKKNSRKPEADSLILDGLKLKTFTAADVEAFQQFAPAAKALSMNQCSLTSLAGIPAFPELEVLEMHDNRLNGAEIFEEIALKFPKLQSLLMAGNKVGALEQLDALKRLESLTEIDLEMNPVMSAVKRDAVFEALPKLEIVNGYTKDGREIEEEKSVDEEEEAGGENADGATGGRSLLASLINGKFEDDEDDLEDYVPESDDYDSECSMEDSAGEGPPVA